MRFKAQAAIRDVRDRVLGEATSPGAEGVHAVTIAEQPHRVTVRASDAPLGQVQAFAGLPYVPLPRGLRPEAHPTNRFIAGTILCCQSFETRFLINSLNKSSTICSACS